jgi:hypothetical protein
MFPTPGAAGVVHEYVKVLALELLLFQYTIELKALQPTTPTSFDTTVH